MSSKRLVYAIAVLLVFSIGVYGLPQSSAPNGVAQALPQASSIGRQADPPSTSTRLIREYLLPPIPVTTIAYFGPSRGPYGIVYDDTGYTWVTDFNRDAVYRLTPAIHLNDTVTTASEWPLPSTQGKRCPFYIIVDEARQVVWFTDPTSRQISRLNWSTSKLDDWNLANLTVMPLDLVMESSSVIWFTGLNDTRFFKLDTASDLVTPYTFSIAVGASVPARPTRIAINGTSLFMTDWKFDRLYEVPLSSFGNAFNYPLLLNGFSWDVDVDPNNNAWVTQPLSSFINDQLAHSQDKGTYQITQLSGLKVSPVQNTTVARTLNITIEVTPVTPSEFHGYYNRSEDPLVAWKVPTDVTALTYVPPPARPWDIAASSDGYAWFTEPIYNHIGVVQPDTNMTLLYGVPTAKSWPVGIGIEPGVNAQPYHVWFTEYLGGKIGELFNASAVDVRVCPSLPAQYPPPSPGSIRWTPGVEIWIDAPSNGYDATHHDSAERGVTNHLYARVKNMGSTSASSIAVKFYWYRNTSVSLALNYIPLPPGTPSTSWASIGSTTITSLAAGSTTDVYVEWTIASDLPTLVTVGAQVSLTDDSNLYDNVGYCNFTLTSPTGAPSITIPGIAIGLAAGLGLMAVVLLLRRR